MRYVFMFVFVSALVASPSPVGAQEGGKGVAPPSVGTEAMQKKPEPVTRAETSPWLRLELDTEGLSLTSGKLQKQRPGHRSEHRAATPTRDEEPEPVLNPYAKKVRNAKVGIGVSAAAAFVGGVMAVSGTGPGIDFSEGSSSSSGGDVVVWVGTAVAAAGAVSMIATGILLRKRKRELRDYEEKNRIGSRRVQWDPYSSRLVF